MSTRTTQPVTIDIGLYEKAAHRVIRSAQRQANTDNFAVRIVRVSEGQYRQTNSTAAWPQYDTVAILVPVTMEPAEAGAYRERVHAEALHYQRRYRNP